MITIDDIKKIATLAKLQLSQNALDQYTQELGQILTFVEKLNELKLDKVEPTSHAVEVTNVFRDDVAIVSPVSQKAFEAAPAVEEHLFVVPKII